MDERGVTRALRERARQEDGVMLVLVAVCLVVFLGAAALAIDLGSFFGAQKKAQAAADAAALAAAHDVGQDPNYGQATTDVQTYVSRNDPGAKPTISYPSAHRVRVTVNASAPTFFGQIFGQTSENVSASATAGAVNQAPAAAVFASDTTCGAGITFTGSNSVTIDGSVHSNGSITFGGSSGQTIDGTASYGGPNGCSASTNSSTTVNGGLWRDPAVVPWPRDYSPVDALCSQSPTPAGVTVSSTPLTWSGNGTTQIQSGIYCAPSVSITGSLTVTGTATFIADSITIGGNVTFDVTPDSTDLAKDLPASSGLSDLVIYQTGTSQLQLQGSALNSDTVFAPHATIVVQGNSVETVNGFIEAQDVQFAGTSALMITGTGPAIPGDSSANLTQ